MAETAKAPPSTRERLLLTAAQLFRRQGLAGTGLKQVVAEAGVPWGSLYHFFPGGKAAFAAAVIRHSGARYEKLIALAFERGGDPVEGTRLMYGYSAQALTESDYGDGCPIGTVALDTASTSAPVREACADAFAGWHALIAGQLVDAGLPAPQAETRAGFSIATFEGAIMLVRTRRDTVPMEQACETVCGVLASALAAPDQSSSSR